MSDAFLVKHSLVDLSYKALKEDIVTRQLTPGNKLIIKDLSDKYGISETPIKQALNRLVSEGLIEVIPRKGMRVRKIKWEEIEELLELRYMIETFYVKSVLLSVQNNKEINDKFVNNISEHKRIIEHAVKIDNYFQHYQHDREFHQIYVACSKNKKSIDLYKNLGTHLYMYYIYGRQDTTRIMEAFQEHECIYNAIMNNDEQSLINSIKAHIFKGKEDIKSIFEKFNDSQDDD